VNSILDRLIELLCISAACGLAWLLITWLIAGFDQTVTME
jgi:uncharacterized RDD family membrane protein YckC